MPCTLFGFGLKWAWGQLPHRSSQDLSLREERPPVPCTAGSKHLTMRSRAIRHRSPSWLARWWGCLRGDATRISSFLYQKRAWRRRPIGRRRQASSLACGFSVAPAAKSASAEEKKCWEGSASLGVPCLNVSCVSRWCCRVIEAPRGATIYPTCT